MNTLLRFLVTLILSTAWVLATYIMDDTNTTIQYLPSNEWAQNSDPSAYNGT
jgi:hypothetical protein